MLTDGFAGTFRRQHGRDARYCRQGIEPGDERPRLLAVLQPAVDLFLDGLGEASDFTFGRCVQNFYGAI